MLTKNTMDMQRIKRITEAGAISGSEKAVTRMMKDALKNVADDFDYDNLGSLICHKKGSGKAMATQKIGFLYSASLILRSLPEDSLI